MIVNKEERKAYMKIYCAEHKEEMRERSKRWYKNNTERKKEYYKRWRLNNLIKIKECNERFNKNNPNYFKNWIKNNVEKASAIFRRYREKNQERIKSQRIANKAYPIKQICSITGCNNLGERHHIDYDKPLEILWLCRKHHREFHKNIL